MSEMNAGASIDFIFVDQWHRLSFLICFVSVTFLSLGVCDRHSNSDLNI